MATIIANNGEYVIKYNVTALHSFINKNGYYFEVNLIYYFKWNWFCRANNFTPHRLPKFSIIKYFHKVKRRSQLPGGFNRLSEKLGPSLGWYNFKQPSFPTEIAKKEKTKKKCKSGTFSDCQTFSCNCCKTDCFSRHLILASDMVYLLKSRSKSMIMIIFLILIFF